MINVHVLAGEELNTNNLTTSILEQQEDITMSGMLRWYIGEVQHIAVILDDVDQQIFMNIAKEFEHE